MPIEPKLPTRKIESTTKKCVRCGKFLTPNFFTKTRSVFQPGGSLPICNGCITEYLKKNDYSWQSADKLCQWADIPFIVKEWTRLADITSPDLLWETYSRVFESNAYADFGWDSYDKQYRAIKEAGLIEQEIPLVKEQKYDAMRKNWGANYDDEELDYLEDLYNGVMASQSVTGALQIDQARKICKLSAVIDSKIRAGDKDVDKFLGSYDKLVKVAEFTPKNAKGAADFDSFSELAVWLEKRGKQNKFYDGTTRDIIDETLKNIENYNQKLYVNEGNIGQEITSRIEALKNVKEDDNVFGLNGDFDLDEYENANYDMSDNDEFVLDLGNDEDKKNVEEKTAAGEVE